MAYEGALMTLSTRIREWLSRASPAKFSVVAVLAAFAAYFCMYAFRKPFAVGTYTGLEAFGLPLKDALVISQVIGYALSKFIGIKWLSELSPQRRTLSLVSLIVIAELSLLLFAVVPTEWKVAAILLNGLPLGAVWGLVFGFLEGRRTSELLGAGLSCSYIVASGAVKSVGKGFIDFGVPEAWMPVVTGLVFLPGFFLAVWALSLLPQPDSADVSARSERVPMFKKERRHFARSYFGGLAALIVLYVAMTAFRDFRDNYAAEIWKELGNDSAHIFTVTELPIAFAVMVALALLFLVRDNRRGLLMTHGLMFAGAVTLGGSTVLFDAGLIGGLGWMIGIGLGLYMAYVPFGCVLFDRMLAATGFLGTSVFMIYVADAAGYGGSVALVLYRQFAHAGVGTLDFVRVTAYVTAALSMAGFAYSAFYFAARSRAAGASPLTAPEGELIAER